MSSRIGPNAKVRIDGKGEHDLTSINFDISKEKTPYTPLGKDAPDRYTSAPKTVTWSGDVQCRPDGSTAIDWEDLCTNDKTVPLVFEAGIKKERLVDACVDSVGNAIQREDGKWTKSIAGKALEHRWE